ncbi:MAG: M13 family metallopeptidase [Ferroplasma sp.]
MENNMKILKSLLSEKDKPSEPKFSIGYMDKNADPMLDFDKYCNGTWKMNNPIPEDKAEWDATMELIEKNRYILAKIAEKCALSSEDNREYERKIVGDFYTSAMNIERIEKLQFDPIKDIMQKVEDTESGMDIIKISSYLQSIGISCFFAPFSDSDQKNSSIYSFYIYQGGLSLPGKDYYTEAKFEDIRNKFIEHMKKMFVLYGYGETEAEQFSKTVIDIENKMASFSRRPEELRDPEKNYNRMGIAEIIAKFPELHFKIYMEGIHLDNPEYIIIGQPEFLDGLNNIMKEVPVCNLKIYLKWKILNFSAEYLHHEIEEEDFDFFNRILLGQEKPEKRWKTAISEIDGSIGEALGKLYVEEEFKEESRNRMQLMIDDLMETFADRLKNLGWMSDETKNKAIEKFKGFRAKIGYPSKFIDYSRLEIQNDDYFGNVIRSNEFEFRRQIDRINKPVDKDLWEMTPPTVNAYFSPTENEIFFPAGILQPPFFDPDLDDSVNYGATGATIAHEITHGFDDEGRLYDEHGNIKDWWTEKDSIEFNKKAKEVVSIYSKIEVLPGYNINGKLTLGENIADIGGVSIAYEALERRLKKQPELNVKIDGFTPEQRFYIGWAQSWRTKIRDDALKYQATEDSHSPGKVRAEVPVWVQENFEKHFSEFSKSKSNNFPKVNIW